MENIPIHSLHMPDRLPLISDRLRSAPMMRQEIYNSIVVNLLEHQLENGTFRGNNLEGQKVDDEQRRELARKRTKAAHKEYKILVEKWIRETRMKNRRVKRFSGETGRQREGFWSSERKVAKNKKLNAISPLQLALELEDLGKLVALEYRAQEVDWLELEQSPFTWCHFSWTPAAQKDWTLDERKEMGRTAREERRRVGGAGGGKRSTIKRKRKGRRKSRRKSRKSRRRR
jgi:hypothetical protein